MSAATALLFLLTFACGAAYECGCVFWVHYSEANKAGRAVAWSCFNALVTVIGAYPVDTQERKVADK